MFTKWIKKLNNTSAFDHYPLTSEGVHHAYKDNVSMKRRITTLITAIVSLTIVITAFSFFTRHESSKPHPILTYLNDSNGNTKEVQAIRNIETTDRQAKAWSEEVAAELLSLNYDEDRYFQSMQRRAAYFSGNGIEDYQLSIIQNGILDELENNKYNITAINADSARIIETFKHNGRRNWIIQMPVVQTVEGASSNLTSTSKVVSMVVEAVPRNESIHGLKVRVFDVQE